MQKDTSMINIIKMKRIRLPHDSIRSQTVLPTTCWCWRFGCFGVYLWGLAFRCRLSRWFGAVCWFEKDTSMINNIIMNLREFFFALYMRVSPTTCWSWWFGWFACPFFVAPLFVSVVMLLRVMAFRRLWFFDLGSLMIHKRCRDIGCAENVIIVQCNVQFNVGVP